MSGGWGFDSFGGGVGLGLGLGSGCNDDEDDDEQKDLRRYENDEFGVEMQ